MHILTCAYTLRWSGRAPISRVPAELGGRERLLLTDLYTIGPCRFAGWSPPEHHCEISRGSVRLLGLSLWRSCLCSR
jgi:hypothetical protein